MAVGAAFAPFRLAKGNPVRHKGIGQKMILPKVRQDIPRVLDDEDRRGETYGFRYVEIRRGAHFTGVPAGRTAYLFDQMKLEAAPWFLTLVPAS